MGVTAQVLTNGTAQVSISFPSPSAVTNVLYINVIIFKKDYFIQVTSTTVFLTVIQDTNFPVSEPLTNFFMGVTEYEKDSTNILLRTRITTSIRVLNYFGLRKFRFTYFKVSGLTCPMP
jgi:hypothetical protein